MGIIERFKASWVLAKLSWNVLMQDKELLFFPIIAAIGAVLMFVLIVIPAAFIPVSAAVTQSATGTHIIANGAGLTWPAIIIAYFAAAFVTIFMQAALIACVKKRLHGGDPTIGYGLKEAGKRFVPILLWSLIATTVGVLLRVASNRSREDGGAVGIIGQVVVSIIGFAWAIITMFVIPVIVIENLGVVDSFKRATQLVRKTWGEQIIMVIGVSTLFGYIYGAMFIIALVTAFLMPYILVPLIIIFVLVAAGLLILQTTLEGIFNGVLYSYAAGDNIPREFKEELKNVFAQKK